MQNVERYLVVSRYHLPYVHRDFFRSQTKCDQQVAIALFRFFRVTTAKPPVYSLSGAPQASENLCLLLSKPQPDRTKKQEQDASGSIDRMPHNGVGHARMMRHAPHTWLMRMATRTPRCLSHAREVCAVLLPLASVRPGSDVRRRGRREFGDVTPSSGGAPTPLVRGTA